MRQFLDITVWRMREFNCVGRNRTAYHARIAAYKPLEVELLYNGVGLDVLGVGYEKFPSHLREEVVAA